MNRSGVSRRDFLCKSAVGASALALGAGGRARAAQSDEARIAFIGVGGRGTRLLRFTSRIPSCRIVAVCDLKTDRVARARREVEKQGHKAKGYTDFREMMEKEKLDGIIVATEVANHAGVVVPVLEAGYHCFSEKPMDATVENVDRIVKAARKAKCIYQVGFQRRYNANFIGAMKRLHSGDLGKVLFMQGHWHFPGGFGGWVPNVEISGCRLVEQACHHMDVLSWAMKNGHPTECVGMASINVEYPNPPRIVSEDHSALVYRFAEGAILSYTHQSFVPEPWCGEKLWVYGDRWGIDLSQGLLYTKDRKTEKIAEPSDYYKGTVEELEGFVENVRKDGKDKVLSNVETARVATLMAIMGRMAFRDIVVKNDKVEKNTLEPRVIKWEDLGSTT